MSRSILRSLFTRATARVALTAAFGVGIAFQSEATAQVSINRCSTGQVSAMETSPGVYSLSVQARPSSFGWLALTATTIGSVGTANVPLLGCNLLVNVNAPVSQILVFQTDAQGDWAFPAPLFVPPLLFGSTAHAQAIVFSPNGFEFTPRLDVAIPIQPS